MRNPRIVRMAYVRNGMHMLFRIQQFSWQQLLDRRYKCKYVKYKCKYEAHQVNKGHNDITRILFDILKHVCAQLKSRRLV